MFKLIQVTPVAGDCTCGYILDFDQEYTVKEFIETVLNEIGTEWGRIEIFDEYRIYDKHECEYCHGKLKSKPLPEENLIKKIKRATAHGGWGNMDYHIVV